MEFSFPINYTVVREQDREYYLDIFAARQAAMERARAENTDIAVIVTFLGDSSKRERVAFLIPLEGLAETKEREGWSKRVRLSYVECADGRQLYYFPGTLVNGKSGSFLPIPATTVLLFDAVKRVKASEARMEQWRHQNRLPISTYHGKLFTDEEKFFVAIEELSKEVLLREQAHSEKISLVTAAKLLNMSLFTLSSYNREGRLHTIKGQQGSLIELDVLKEDLARIRAYEQEHDLYLFDHIKKELGLQKKHIDYYAREYRIPTVHIGGARKISLARIKAAMEQEHPATRATMKHGVLEL